MPIYEYQCASCGQRFERIQRFSDPPVTACPACGGDVQKLLSSPAIQFKGSGFYITDYVKTGQSGKDSPAESGTSKESQAADKSAPEKKPAGDQPTTAPTTKSDPAPKGSDKKASPAATSD